MIGAGVEGDDAGCDIEGEGLREECLALRLRQPLLRVDVRGPHLVIGRVGRDAAVVVAAHRRQVQRLQPCKRLARPEWAGNAVAEIDGEIGAATPRQILQHGIQRQYVAVDIGEDGYAHAAGSLGAAPLEAFPARLRYQAPALTIKPRLLLSGS